MFEFLKSVGFIKFEFQISLEYEWLNKAQYDRSRNFRVLRLTSLTYTDMRSDLTDSLASVTSDITSRRRKNWQDT